MSDDLLSPEFIAKINAVASAGTTLTTVSNGKPNEIVEVLPEGVLVQTERSSGRGSGPQLVPAALLLADWETLESRGRLRLREAGHRGSFSCALFARFPDVEVESTRPVVLRLRRS